MGQPVGEGLALRLWTGACAWARGRDHRRHRTPCQDRAQFLHRKGVACVALADGAGSRPLSHMGAQAAVRAAVFALTGDFDRLQREPEEQCREALFQTLRGAVEARAAREGRVPEDLGSTVLALAVRGDRFVLCHLGDGVVVRVRSQGEQVWSPPQGGEFANQTFFLTGPEARSRFRFLRGRLDGEDRGAVLLSDGAAHSLYRRRDAQVSRACSVLTDWCGEASSREVREALRRNLRDLLVLRTGDDCSVAVLGRVTLGLEDLEALPPRRRRELLGASRGSYEVLHRRVLRDLEDRGEGEALSARARRLGVCRSVLRVHLRRAGWERVGDIPQKP